MSAVARAKSKKPAAPRAPRPEAVDLTRFVELRSLTRFGILELMRLAAGLSYRDLAARVGLPPARLTRLIRRAEAKAPSEQIERVWRALWEALPRSTPRLVDEPERLSDTLAEAAKGLPIYLSLGEAARLLRVNVAKMRRLAVERPELRAIKFGAAIRLPRHALYDYISAPLPAPRRREPGLRTPDLAALFRVSHDVISYQRRQGRIAAVRRHGSSGQWFVPDREIARLMAFGIEPLRPLASDTRKRRQRRVAGGSP